MKIQFPGKQPDTQDAKDAAAVLEFVAGLVPAVALPDGRSGINAREVVRALLGALVMLHSNLGPSSREGLQADIRQLLVFLYSPEASLPTSETEPTP